MARDLTEAEERYKKMQFYSQRQDACPGVAFVRAQFPLVVANIGRSVTRRDIRSFLDDEHVEETQIR